MPETTYTDWVEYSHAQLRFVLETERGTPTRFLVQLEYCVDGGWQPVVHFDHNPEGTYGHDLTEEGLHMDIYRDGEQHLVREDFPPVELSNAPDYCESYIKTEASRLLRRYEQWHNLTTDR
ncbi:hypothetical protein MUK72_14555 (plasmid) [Halococcus dombrowskii]|uniref:DUF7718 domain-containing protein n=1 Tax=Halococcus dombrowskii TaxID=179637 RepID=A0AAV3SEE2_HALDO|nr:hypothetical protein [Halococcus dombrowskii]UOO96766.1 hypothetical protein MUK72_14555 [Halococcus dombrowskii]